VTAKSATPNRESEIIHTQGIIEAIERFRIQLETVEAARSNRLNPYSFVSLSPYWHVPGEQIEIVLVLLSDRSKILGPLSLW
jgi:hypothetical protein